MPSLEAGVAHRVPAEFVDRMLPGMTRLDLAHLFAQRGYVRGAEIGVADGRFSLALCQTIPGLALACVDPWQPYAGNVRGGPLSQHSDNYHAAQQRLAPYDVTFMRGMSLDMVQQVPLRSLDFVYIDGNHDFDYVVRDLIAWAPRVRPGGIVAGHDFYHFPRRRAGVVEAVDAYTRAHDITAWSLTEEREPSFWWEAL